MYKVIPKDKTTHYFVIKLVSHLSFTLDILIWVSANRTKLWLSEYILLSLTHLLNIPCNRHIMETNQSKQNGFMLPCPLGTSHKVQKLVRALTALSTLTLPLASCTKWSPKTKQHIILTSPWFTTCLSNLKFQFEYQQTGQNCDSVNIVFFHWHTYWIFHTTKTECFFVFWWQYEEILLLTNIIYMNSFFTKDTVFPVLCTLSTIVHKHYHIYICLVLGLGINDGNIYVKMMILEYNRHIKNLHNFFGYVVDKLCHSDTRSTIRIDC